MRKHDTRDTGEKKAQIRTAYTNTGFYPGIRKLQESLSALHTKIESSSVAVESGPSLCGVQGKMTGVPPTIIHSHQEHKQKNIQTQQKHNKHKYPRSCQKHFIALFSVALCPTIAFTYNVGSML